MEARIPGLGGVFLDPQQNRVVVYLKDLSQRDLAMMELRSIGPSLPVKRSFRAKLGVEGTTEIRRGQFSFSQLVDWQHTLLRADLPSIIAVDANEKLNRVRVTIPRDATPDAIRQSLTALGVPDSALAFEPGDYPQGVQSYVTDRRRPTWGGMQFQNGSSATCTLGFPVEVQFYNVKGWVTASHCAAGTLGSGQTGGNIYQNVQSGGASNLIGTVNINPAWDLTDADCGAQSVCSLGDVMFILASDTSASNYEMRIAVANQWNSHVSTNTSGPTTLFGYVGNLEIVPYIYTGAVVYKTGRSSGTTGGTIEATCETYNIPGGYGRLLCMTRVEDMYAGAGDSGSPVFYPADSEGSAPLAIGIVAATDGCVGTCEVWFTEWHIMESRLSRYFLASTGGGSSSGMSATVQGSTTAWQGANLTWNAQPSGGTSPFWYEWAGFGGQLTGSGSSVNFSPTSGGDIDLVVWDAFGNYAHTSLTVTWCGQYAC